jgi:hypothetical protein
VLLKCALFWNNISFVFAETISKRIRKKIRPARVFFLRFPKVKQRHKWFSSSVFRLNFTWNCILKLQTGQETNFMAGCVVKHSATLFINASLSKNIFIRLENQYI